MVVESTIRFGLPGTPTLPLAKRRAISIRAIYTAFRNHRTKPILAANDIFCRNVNPKVFITEPGGIIRVLLLLSGPRERYVGGADSGRQLK